MALSGMDGNMSLVKNEAQAVPAAVQRSSSLDSMQQNAVAGILPSDSEMLPASMPSTSSANNSLSPPCQPVQRSRSLPLLDTNQGISPELLANLTAADRGNILGNNSVGIEDSLSTSQPNHQGGQFLQQHQQQEFLSPSHFSGLSQQPLNLSQSADVKQFLSPFQQHMFPRPNMTRPVRNLIPHLGDWGGYQTGGRFQLRGVENSMAGLPTLGPQVAGYNQAIFNPSVSNIYSKVMDKALGFPVSDAFSFGRENVPFPSGQPVMNMNPLRQQGNFDGKVSKDGERQMNINLPKDGRGNLVQAHQHHSENNNDKTSPNMQALSDSVGGQLGDKAMLPLSVSVSVAFSEPSQDSPASLSRHSNSPAMPYRTSADQMLSMINYNEDQLLQEHGLMADNTVTGTLDDNFLSSSMGIGHPSTTRLTDSSNLAGMDSSPPSVNNEAFDLFDGGGDVEDANYMTDSLSPQPLAGNVDSDVHVTTSLASIGGQSGGDVLTSLPRNMGRGGFRVSAGKNPPEMKSPPNQGVNNDGGSTDMPPRRKGRPPSRNPGHRYSQPCQVCGKIFGSSSALAKHKLIHSSERRHKCVLCAKSFKRQDHLAGHMLTHRSKKPYECTVPDCGKSYCDIRSLRRHFESQHHGLPMENNMRFTGDEKDPELTAAEEAAAMQAQVQAQGHPSSALPNNSSYLSNALSGVSAMGNLPVNNFGQGMMQPASQQSPQQQQQQQHQHQQQQQQHQQQQQQPLLQQKHSGMNNASNQSPDSPGSSSTPALQFLVRAAHYAQSSLPIAATSPNNQSDVSPLVINPQIPVPQDIPALNRLADLMNPAAPSQLSPSTWNMTSQYEPLSNPKIMEVIPAPRLVTTMAGLTTNSLNNQSSRRVLGSSPGSMDVRQPSPRGPSPGKSSDSKDKTQQPVECSVCKRTFKSMPALNGHMRLHGGYNNARGESSDTIKGEPKYQPRQQQVPTPPRTSQSRSTPDMRGNHQVVNTAPSVLSLPNHHLPPSLSQASLGQMSMQPAPLHVSVPAPSFTVPMPGLSQPPPQMTHLPNLNSLRTEQLELQAQVKQELNVPSIPKQPNPFFSEASFVHHHQQLPTSYPQFMPVPLPPLKDMPYAVPVNYHPGALQTVQKVPKLEPFFSTFEQQIGMSFSAPETELSPPRLEAIKPSDDQNVFRNPPPPTQPSPTKKRPRPSPLHIPSCVSTGTPGGIIPGTYQSQMRSPRELGSFYIHHAYRSAGTGTTPPPYTPPPMLSPIRSGPGLYFNVPTMTPKTPGMMSMHRRNSSAAADEPVSDFVFSSEPHINVGSDFQAKIPDLLESQDDLLTCTPDHRQGWVAWDPSNSDKYTISELTNFLQLATSAALPGGARNLEYAHHCLHRADGDIELALKMLMKPDPPVENPAFGDYNYNFTSTWSQGERKIFRDHFKSKGKDFHEIQKGLPTKSVKEIVEYYYRWKKLFPYNRDMQKFCHHSRINPTEDMRRNECDLYPEETFIDYVPLKEYRPDKYYRGGGQTRNNNHVKTSSNQEEKPANQGSFTCNYPDCGASFKSRQALNGHIRVHGGSYKSQTVAKEPPPVQRSVSPLSVSTVSTSGTSRRMSTDSSSGESVEPEPVTFPCKLCGKVFYKVKSRSAHMKSHRKPELVKKVPSLSPQENSPPEFGTEPINHYVNNYEDMDEDDDDFPNEAGGPDDGSSSSGRSGTGSRSDSSGSSSYGDSDSETGNSDTVEPMM